MHINCGIIVALIQERPKVVTGVFIQTLSEEHGLNHVRDYAKLLTYHT